MNRRIGIVAFVLVIAFFAAPWRKLFAQTATTPSVTLTWLIPSADVGVITEETVYRATSASGPWTLIASINNGTAVTYTDTTGTPGTAYYYEVDALNGNASSGPSNVVSAASLVNPTPPTALSAVAN